MLGMAAITMNVAYSFGDLMRVITSVNSQVIEQIAFDTYTRALFVTINGSDYTYLNISFEQWRSFITADSKGSFFNMYVRGRW